MDSEDEPSRDRVTIEETVRVTDEIVNEKDLQIERLKAEIQSLGEMVMADCHTDDQAEAEKGREELLDADAVIQQERTNLEKLQNEWREKLRAAEVEIAVERAQNTRLRNELEEKLGDVKVQLAQAKKMAQAATNNSQSATPKSTWLGRLGLGDHDQR